MAKWDRAFASLQGKIDDRTAQVVRESTLELGSAIAMDNPVGDSEDLSEHVEAQRVAREAAKINGDVYQPTDRYVGGHSRWNWQASVGELVSIERDGVDPDGSATISRMKLVLSAVRAGDTVFIANPVDYAVGLEYGNSRKAPKGMARINAVRFPSMVSAAAKRARK